MLVLVSWDSCGCLVEKRKSLKDYEDVTCIVRVDMKNGNLKWMVDVKSPKINILRELRSYGVSGKMSKGRILVVCF